MTVRGFCAEDAESRYASGRPERVTRSKTGKSARRAAPSRIRVPAGSTAIAGRLVRLDRLRRGGLVADSGGKPDLIADPVVPVGLELVAQLLAAAHHDATVEQDVHELRLHVVQ